jgi:hypothetical protein
MIGRLWQMLARLFEPKPEDERKRKASDLTALQHRNWVAEQRLRILEKRAQLHRE